MPARHEITVQNNERARTCECPLTLRDNAKMNPSACEALVLRTHMMEFTNCPEIRALTITIRSKSSPRKTRFNDV